MEMLNNQQEYISKSTGTQANNNTLSLPQLLLSGIYLWHVFFASIFHLRLYLFITTFESLLKCITAGDAKTGMFQIVLHCVS